MMRFLLVLLCSLMFTVFAEEEKKTWSENFEVKEKEGILPKGWEVKATKWGVNETSFELKNKQETKKIASGIIGVLKVFANEATGALFCEPYHKVDLIKTPVLRWRWQVNKFPEGGDGRKEEKDDQALVIYIGASDWMIKKSIAYRWETETPEGFEGDASYGGGAVQVKWICLRNRKSGQGKWIVEERNIAEDFKKAFGFIPKEFVLSIGANSQNTKSESLAFVDYIEFLPLGKSKKIEVAENSKKK